ncbi:methyltransferase [Kitasatospora sp. NPDC059327]|uniref:methyltransferase n=1 Tax=Kitasatospora sp. NPDC059327 TaxID=3346803 RepID=UPI0036CE1625
MTQPASGTVGGPGEILRLTMAFYGSRVLISAVELDLFTVLADGSLTGPELCRSVGLHPRGASDFLDSLVALGLLERDQEQETYRNSPAAARYLDRRKPGYVGGYAGLADARLMPLWSHLTEALRTGEPQVPAHTGFFDGYSDKEAARSFLGAMDAVNSGVAVRLAKAFDWSRYTSLVDLGGARGNLATTLLREHPHLRAVCFDLPEMKPFFNEHLETLEASGTSARVRFEAGDFFTTPLPEGDVFVVGHILHFLSLEQRRELLSRIRRALRPGGAVLVYDRMIDDDRRGPALSLLGSLNMLLTSSGGREYTPAECHQWLIDAGFESVRTMPLGQPDTLAVGHLGS